MKREIFICWIDWNFNRPKSLSLAIEYILYIEGRESAGWENDRAISNNQKEGEGEDQFSLSLSLSSSTMTQLNVC